MQELRVNKDISIVPSYTGWNDIKGLQELHVFGKEPEMMKPEMVAYMKKIGLPHYNPNPERYILPLI